MKTTKKTTKRIPVLVTTAHRGVFFGYANPKEIKPEGYSLELTGMRNCIYWSSDMNGFLGLAQAGPSSTCKIGPAVDKSMIHAVTSVTSVTSEAEAKWNSWG